MVKTRSQVLAYTLGMGFIWSTWRFYFCGHRRPLDQQGWAGVWYDPEGILVPAGVFCLFFRPTSPASRRMIIGYNQPHVSLTGQVANKS
jgi:hypothetical protein